MQQTLHDSVQVAVARLVDDDADRRSALVMTQMAGVGVHAVLPAAAGGRRSP